jgi:murein DD-endopeptidase MepM/ murein hydrolase activator NlpD
MANPKDRKLFSKLKDKYRLIIYNDGTFKEVWFIKLTPINLLALGGTLFVSLLLFFYLLVAYTSLREFIPGYPDAAMRRAAWINSLLLDSLEQQIDLRDKKLSIISDIINGKEPGTNDSIMRSIIPPKTAGYKKTSKDSLSHPKNENADPYKIADVETNASRIRFTNQTFFPPVRGLVTNNFNPEENHFGTDIVSQPNEVVKAVMDGTVIFSAWTIETGYTLAIQHSNNYISVYKHNSELLKQAGNYIKAGDVIAIVGNSGELTTGPHLHLELWHDGTPLNPEDFIVF